jgi:hypothetical protein
MSDDVAMAVIFFTIIGVPIAMAVWAFLYITCKTLCLYFRIKKRRVK